MRKKKSPEIVSKILEAYETSSQRVWVVHLDRSRLLPPEIDAEGNEKEPQPHPEWVETFAWGLDVPREVAMRETKLLVADRLRARGVLGRKPDPAEGEEFSV